MRKLCEVQQCTDTTKLNIVKLNIVLCGESAMSQINSLSPVELAGKVTSLGRFIAKPKNRLGDSFQQVMQGVRSAADTAASLSGVGGDYSAILQQQMEMQRQMMTVSMVSNTERTRHETNMVGIRNMRVS
jgi:hypothetical protein